MKPAKRLNSPDDYVRQELEIGLTKHNRVVPILIDSTPDISPDQLPESLLDTSGMVYVYMNDLERSVVFRTREDREAFVNRLNTVQGIAIKSERAGNAFVALNLGNVDRTDIDTLLSIIKAELETRPA